MIEADDPSDMWPEQKVTVVKLSKKAMKNLKRNLNTSSGTPIEQTDDKELERILKLNRSPNAPDVMTLKPYKNPYGFWRRDCPKCGSPEKDIGFYNHWTRTHEPNWRLKLIQALIHQQVREAMLKHG